MSFVVGAVAAAIELGTVAAIATAVSYVGIAMTVVGTVTKSKELTKIGSVLGVAGGIASLGAAVAGSAGAASAAGTAATSGAVDAGGELAADSLWSEAASQAAGDTIANAAIDGANATTASSFSGAASTAADAAIGAGEGIGAAAPDLASQYELTAGGDTIAKGATGFAPPTPTAPAPVTPAADTVTQSATGDALTGASESAMQNAAGGAVPKPGLGQNIKDWYNGLSKDAQSRVNTSLLQAGGQAIGGLFQGWSADQQLALQKEMYDRSVKNASAVPKISFKPVGLVNNATKGG